MNKIIIKIFDTFTLSAAAFLLFIVVFNIIARQVHDASAASLSFMIPGVIELSKYTLLILIFSALPRMATQGLVRVDLLSNKFSPALNYFLDKVWLVLLASFTSILAWLFSHKMLLTFRRGDATQDLQIPLFYLYAFISLACIATTLVCLLKIIQTHSEREA